MTAVIADDITGAAEIGGIAWRYGFDVRLLVATSPEDLPAVDFFAETSPQMLWIVATDTRSGETGAAREMVSGITCRLTEAGFTAFFKKCDSVLRGHVATETAAMLETVGLKRALLLPENPSRDRTIRGGLYYIGDTPLDRTPFADDPEFPARTADVAALLGGRVEVIDPQQPLPALGIIVGEASGLQDMAAQVGKADRDTLLVGGADCFEVWLRRRGCTQREDAPKWTLPKNAAALIVCGSSVDHQAALENALQNRNIALTGMPAAVFRGEDTGLAWAAQLEKTYRQHGSLCMTVGHPPAGGRETAERLRREMARAVGALLEIRRPDELIVEGGATAFAILQTVGWRVFRVAGEIAAGIVRLSVDGTPGLHLTLKPGSYPWNALFDDIP